ncbi:MAG: hypothetical protein ACI853_001262, partial [Paracoccaceae bacterium]
HPLSFGEDYPSNAKIGSTPVQSIEVVDPERDLSSRSIVPFCNNSSHMKVITLLPKDARSKAG